MQPTINNNSSNSLKLVNKLDFEHKMEPNNNVQAKSVDSKDVKPAGNVQPENKIEPAIMNLIPLLRSGGMVSIDILIAKKLEPFITQSATSIIHILVRCDDW